MQPFSAPPKSAPPGFDRDRLVTVIAPVVRAHGAELHDVELKNENGWVLRVYVEKLGANELRMTTKEAAVDLDLCSSIARDLSPALDVADPIPHRYSLEVSSPGIERPLKREADYVRFAGEKAKLKLGKGVQGQKVLVGLLGDVKDGVVALVDGEKTYEVPLADVLAARLVFEFGPASKPGGPNSKRQPKKKRK
jgi:ribosome maturation factor RimP